MKTGAKWGIALGVGIPVVLILIGVLGILIKFFMKRCRKRAWDDISSLPKYTDTLGNDGARQQRHSASERQPLNPAATSSSSEVPQQHTTIPIDDVEIRSGRRQVEPSLVQVQRDRLNHLKEEENRLRPMIRAGDGEAGVQSAIDQAQKEFDESV